MRKLTLTIFILLFSVFAPTSFAMANVAKLSVDPASGAAGGTVDVAFSISGNPGIAAFTLRAGFDRSALTPVSIEKGAGFALGSFTSNLHAPSLPEGLSDVTAVWINSTDVSTNGVLFKIRFKIAEDASGSYPLRLELIDDGLFNQALESVACEIQSGNLSVSAKGSSGGSASQNPGNGTAGSSGAGATGGAGAGQGGGVSQDGNAANGNSANGNSASGSTSGAVMPPASWVDGVSPSPSAINGGAGWVSPFSDVRQGDWFFGPVAFVCGKGLMNGMAADRFEPGTRLSRAMFVTVLYRAAGSPDVAATTSAAAGFSDVERGAWYADAVSWAAREGIVEGYGGRFGVSEDITREQLATMLYRMKTRNGVLSAEVSALAGFADAGSVSGWAADGVAWAVSAGILNGRSGTELAPRAATTRAEAAAVLQRYLVAR